MTKKDTPKAGRVKKDDPEQSRRFIETARKHGADTEEKAFEKTMNVIKQTADAGSTRK